MHNPKIILGLWIGTILPYIFVSVLTVITKWLIFRSVLRRMTRPSIVRLYTVSVAESLCAVVAMQASGWLDLDNGSKLFAIPLYLLLAMSVNLLLIPSSNQQGRNGLLKRCLNAFPMGLIYYFFMQLTAWLWFTIF
jgi:hypothetical protein